MLTFRLPYPPAILNPNARAHHMRLAAEKKKYRTACAWECKAWGVNRFKAESICLRLEFYPPDNRRRDRDNVIAAFKAGQDAIADVLGRDDSEFHVTYAPMQQADPEHPRGYVLAVLSDAPTTVNVPIIGQIIGDRVVK